MSEKKKTNGNLGNHPRSNNRGYQPNGNSHAGSYKPKNGYQPNTATSNQPPNTGTSVQPAKKK